MTTQEEANKKLDQLGDDAFGGGEEDQGQAVKN